jgi:hypothetical protein
MDPHTYGKLISSVQWYWVYNDDFGNILIVIRSIDTRDYHQRLMRSSYVCGCLCHVCDCLCHVICVVNVGRHTDMIKLGIMNNRINLWTALYPVYRIIS